jgi:hypothetical protein
MYNRQHLLYRSVGGREFSGTELYATLDKQPIDGTAVYLESFRRSYGTTPSDIRNGGQ